MPEPHPTRDPSDAPRWTSPWRELVSAPRPSGRAQVFAALWGLLVVIYVGLPAVSTIAVPDGLTLTAVGILGLGIAELLDPGLRGFAIGLRCTGMATALVGMVAQLL